MWVTRSRTTSFRTSGVSLFCSIANIIEGRHLLGTLKFRGKPDVDLLESLQQTETVDACDGLGEDENNEGDCIEGELTGVVRTASGDDGT